MVYRFNADGDCQALCPETGTPGLCEEEYETGTQLVFFDDFEQGDTGTGTGIGETTGTGTVAGCEASLKSDWTHSVCEGFPSFPDPNPDSCNNFNNDTGWCILNGRASVVNRPRPVWVLVDRPPSDIIEVRATVVQINTPGTLGVFIENGPSFTTDGGDLQTRRPITEKGCCVGGDFIEFSNFSLGDELSVSIKPSNPSLTGTGTVGYDIEFRKNGSGVFSQSDIQLNLDEGSVRVGMLGTMNEGEDKTPQIGYFCVHTK